jgi:hypothetical protein
MCVSKFFVAALCSSILAGRVLNAWVSRLGWLFSDEPPGVVLVPAQAKETRQDKMFCMKTVMPKKLTGLTADYPLHSTKLLDTERHTSFENGAQSRTRGRR